MIDNILRRTAWALVTFLLAASVAADSHHPKLSTSLVISLDVSTIERNAKSSTPFELVFGDTRLNVVLSPAPLWPKEGLTVHEVQRDGSMTTRVVQGDLTYAGDVVGEDPKQSEARFAIVRGVWRGTCSRRRDGGSSSHSRGSIPRRVPTNTWCMRRITSRDRWPTALTA